MKPDPKSNPRVAATSGDPRWASVVARNAAADGTFVYSVKTTGVYCRPSCASRRARPENVSFFARGADAEKAGFRPCKRCKPEQSSVNELNAQRVVRACRFIESLESAPSLTELADHVGMSPYHFHRIFKAATGLTPQQYAANNRTTKVRQSLKRSSSVTNAIYDAGYSSSSRFYENTDAALGMTPSAFRSGGADTEIFFAIGECSLGSILVAQTRRGVCSILLGDDPSRLVENFQKQFPTANLIGNQREYESLVSKVVGMIERPSVGLDLPLDIRGTSFQQRVWKALQQIPLGSTSTYAQIAEKIGYPRSARAVAQACGSNTLAVAIPCHRVIRNDGSLAGYRWGVERKRVLLEREASNADAAAR